MSGGRSYATTRVEVRNVEVIAAALRALPDGFDERVVKGGLRYAARLTLADCKARVRRRTGALAKALVIRSPKKRDKEGQFHLVITARSPWYRLLHLIEFGTAERFTHKGAARGAATAYPFMRPALDTTQEAFVTDFAQGMSKAMEQIVARLRRNAGRV